MSFSEYTSYFHDGTLLDLRHIDNDLFFYLESSYISPSALHKEFVLSKDDTLRGILHAKKVNKIIVNDVLQKTALKMKYHDAEVFHLKTTENHISLLVEWKLEKKPLEIQDVSAIEIDAEYIIWGNIPSLEINES